MKGIIASLLAAASVALCLATPAHAQAVRKNVNDLTASEVASFRRGVAVMVSRNTAPRNSADFRQSWIFWANMHAHFGEDCRGPVRGEGMSTIRTWDQTNAVERAQWCNCVHNQDSFLTWHRLYLYYFERVLRRAANDPDLRLPFWDYAANGQLPAIFRATTYVNDQGRRVANPLRVEDRRPQLNAGTARLVPAVTSAANAMAATSVASFRGRLESTPHGSVHCAMVVDGCPNGLMGSVPISANDPLFWVHHANVDRLWDCWQRSLNGQPTPPALMQEQFNFIDRGGVQVTRRLAGLPIDYTYAPGSDCGAGGRPAAVAVAQAAPAPASSLAKLEPKATVQVTKGAHVLRLNGVMLSQGTAEVMLLGAKGEVSVGVISSFGAMDHPGHNHATREFEVGDALRALGGKSVGIAFRPITGTDAGGTEPAPVMFSTATLDAS